MDAANEDYQNSLYLNAFLASETLMVITTKDAGQVGLVRRLFKPKDRKCIVQGARWHITNLGPYKEIPVVRNAMRAYEMQLQFEWMLR
jgi:hypothetical protein